MKKNISINLQGLIFHIEEDGYDVLSRYLAEVKAHFAGIRGHQDIVADIEGRIAEIFSARLSPSQQVITLDDVNAMTAKMGRVSDFESETDEDDVATDTTEAFGAAGATGAAGNAGTGYPGSSALPGAAPTASGQRRLYRDMVNRKIAGVAAGLGQYFAVNPLWIRLGFLALIFLPRLVFHNGFNFGFRGNFDLSGFSFLAYIVLWIALPKNYDVPTVTPDTDTPYKKLFRDTDTGKVGGVAAGLAAYFNVDVTLVRVLLLAGLFAGGFTFVLYLILWTVLPEAKTVAEKMRMRGDDLTLKNFSQNINNFASEVGAAGRPIGTFVEDMGRGLQPAVGFVGSAIRVVAGLILTLTGFSLLLGLAILLGAGIGLIPNSENIGGDVPAHVFLNGIPTWGLLSGFLTAGIPSLFLLLGGLNLLLRRSLLPRSVNLSLLGLWILSIVGLTMAVAQQSRQYQRSAEVEQLERYAALTTPVLFLDARHVDREWDQRVNLRLAAADSGRVVEVLRTLGARGASEEAARRTALSTIDYTVRPSGDSSLVFDDHFSFLPGAMYRKQALNLTVRLPRERTFRLSRDFAYNLLSEDDFVNSHRPNDPEQHRYRLRGNKLECIACTDEQLGKNDNEDEAGMNLNIDTDNDNADDNSDGDGDNNSDDRNRSGVTLNYGGAPAFDTDLNSYGSDRRTFEETGFNRVEVAGGYRVVVRRGTGFKVEAGGDNKYLDDLRVERNGDALVIRPRNTSFFGGNWGRGERKVLIRIEMPAIEELELAGAVQADLGGFDRQDRLKVQQAGASHLRLNGNYGTLQLEQAGACRTTATGRADSLDLDAAGACELAAANLQTAVATVDLAGVCKARLNVSESLKGDAVGASEIAYSGQPKTVKVDATGPSSIKRL